MHEESSGHPFQPPADSPFAGHAPAGAPDFARFLYNHNPFYVISAALVLYGLRVSFLGGDAFQTRALILGLMSFALLLSGTAWLIIRLGSVWNDARTILLIIVLLFVAISVACDLSLAGFDAGSARDLQTGIENFVGSYLFALFVSEGLLYALGIRLRGWLRLSYHLFLALFFLYPLAIVPVLVHSWDRLLPWTLLGFSLAASLAILALLPVMHRGASYVEHNGTPWRWPLFPWSLFVILGVAAGLRHYYLCLSFHAVPGLDSLFRPYFLVPPLLAVNLLLLEAAVVTRRRRVRILALAMPLGLLALAACRPADTFWQKLFFREFYTVLGGEPVYLTLTACIAFYALAAVRRLAGAIDWLGVSVAALSMIRPLAQLSDPAHPNPWPIVACALIVLIPTLTRRSTARWFVAAGLVLAAFTSEYRQSWLEEGMGAVPWHLLLVVVLVLGSSPRDWFAKTLQELGSVMLCVSAIAWSAWLPELERRAGDWPHGSLLAFGYPLATAGLAFAYGRAVGNKRYFAAAGVDVVLFGGVAGQRAYVLLRPLLAGLDYLLLGAGSFALAALMSLFKTGAPQRWWTKYKAGRTKDQLV
ncbi:MAG TPA: hypothetical protein VHC22_05810 [Pirellulales bacterium]|nr:hypothetical protein [Pirellulales bacterium]